jgi:tight adherence protein B
MSVGDLVGLTVGLVVAGLLVPLWLQQGMFLSLGFATLLGSLPTIYLLHTKAQRLIAIDNQLPDAIDLMGRALRAGHAFPTALSMVGDEMPEPIGAEFRILFDEINYGVSLHNALLNLLSRVPSTDLQYFVVAVLIQRETGGNLAELFDNISTIVRSRMKLMGEVRTLSAEGRMSAWILTLLPFGVGIVIQFTNPGFLSVLWTDPTGLKMVYGALLMMIFGIWWMSRIIKIRV